MFLNLKLHGRQGGAGVVIMVNTREWEAQTHSSVNSKTCACPIPLNLSLIRSGSRLCVAFRVSSMSNIRVDDNMLPYKLDFK